jgi:di/tricarboxylate transporter
VIIILPALYIIGAALYDTGVATVIANAILRLRDRGTLVLLLAIMLGAGTLSAIMSDLLVIAVMLPAVLRVARQMRISPAQFLMPLTTAAVMGDTLTLIAAISTVAINDVLVSIGIGSLGLFSLLPFGAAALVGAIGWFMLLGRRLLPDVLPADVRQPSLDEVEQVYDLEEQLYQLRVRAASDLIGRRLDESGLGATFHLNVIAIQPTASDLQPARPDWILERDDLLIIEGERGDIYQAVSVHHLHPKGAIPLNRFETVEQQSLRLAEVIVPFRSELVGRSVSSSRFRDQYGLNVLAVHRGGNVVRGELADLVLRPGDTLLVQGPLARLRRLGDGAHLVLATHLGPERGDIVTSKMRLTVVIVAAMLLVVVTGLMPLAAAGLAASLSLILSGCISAERAYKSVDSTILVLIGGMLPLATALEKTGLAESLASLIAGFTAGAGPFLTLVVIYILTAMLTQVISNTVLGVLLVPVAVSLALTQGAAPEPFAIAIIVGVTTSYVTPLTHGGNLMIREPGGYTMRDFLVNNGPVFVLQSVSLLTLLYLFFFR